MPPWCINLLWPSFQAPERELNHVLCRQKAHLCHLQTFYRGLRMMVIWPPCLVSLSQDSIYRSALATTWKKVQMKQMFCIYYGLPDDQRWSRWIAYSPFKSIDRGQARLVNLLDWRSYSAAYHRAAQSNRVIWAMAFLHCVSWSRCPSADLSEAKIRRE